MKHHPRHPGVILFIAAALATSAAGRAQAVTPPNTTPAPTKPAAKVPTPAEVAASPAKAVASEDEVVRMSPFEISTDNKGYYAANSMSGTRLNSKIEDMGASITVVTKQQMQDFALLDINDVFSYEAGTEGSKNFSSFSAIRTDSVNDDIANSPQSANRVRGLNSANITLGNFSGSGWVPVDPIAIDALEISRGPNSNIFGIGNAGGSVNSVLASANVFKNRSSVTLRGDSFEGYRATLDLNRVLKPGVLAIRASTVFQHDGYDLKPSGTNTRRLNGMVKYRPFRRTQLSVTYMDYKMTGNRPNNFTPTDGVTAWKAAGAPTWDPITNTEHLNGASFVIASPTSTASIPPFMANILGANPVGLVFVDRGGISYWTANRGSAATSPLTGFQNAFFMSSAPILYSTNQPLFGYNVTSTDRSVYDWKKYNLGAPNYYADRNATTVATLDQVIVDTQRQNLSAQLGWYHETAERTQLTAINQSGFASIGYGGLAVDINERLLDGAPNPYFMRPYVSSVDPYWSHSPYDQDTYRAQIAYKLDLTGEKNWLRWLGLHSVSAYSEYKHTMSRRLRFRPVITSNNSWIPAGIGRATTNAAGGLAPTNYVVEPIMRFYVGDKNGQNVDYGPGSFQYGDYSFNWGSAPGPLNHETVTLGDGVQYPGNRTGGGGNSENILKSNGAILQSHLLSDRIVTTFGLRKDQRFTHSGATPLYNPDGLTINQATYDRWVPGWPSVAEGFTRTAGIVVRPLRWLSFYYNRANSFQPSSPVNSILPYELEPDPKGRGKDSGLLLTFFDGKLVVKANQFETKQLSARIGSISSRVPLPDRRGVPGQSDTPGAGARLQDIAEKMALTAAATRGQTLTGAELQAATAKLMDVPTAFLDPYPTTGITSTRDQFSKGYEFEVNYNPTSYWTMKFNVTQQKSYYNNISGRITEWVAERLPFWQKFVDGNTGQLWYTTAYPGVPNTTWKGYIEANIVAPLKLEIALENKNDAQIRKYRFNYSTNFRLAGITQHKILKNFNVGGALRWEDKGGIGYYGMEKYPAQITSLDPSRPIYNSSHTYIDLLLGYRTRLFKNRVPVTFQLNARNVTENGRLQAVNAYPNGQPTVFRIIDPRQFILSATFEL